MKRQKKVCDNCRHRKRKCDGELPCLSCIDYKAKSKRVVPDCSYSDKPKASTQRRPTAARKDQLLNRLEMLESRLKELITVEGPQTDQLDLESSSGNLSLSSPESSSSTSQYIPNTKLIINNMNKLTSTRNQSPVDLLETLFSTGNSSSSSQFDLTTSFANSLNFTNVHQPSISPTSIGSTPEVIDLVDHLKFLDAANSTSDPYFSHLPQMGNIYQNTEVDYLNQAQKFDNIVGDLHRSLLTCSDLFSKGCIDDGFKLLFYCYLNGKKYDLFPHVTFHFPKNYPTLQNLNSIETNSIPFPKSFEKIVERLWGVCLKIDTYAALAHGHDFIIHETFHSHKILPFTILDVTNYSSQTMRIAVADPHYDVKFNHHLLGARLFKKLNYFSKLPSNSFGIESRTAVVMNFHVIIVAYTTHFHPDTVYFSSLEDFVDLTKPPLPRYPDSCMIDKVGHKFFIAMFALLHRSALMQGVQQLYSFNSLNSFTSQDILILCARALKFTVSLPIEKIMTEVPFFNLDESPRLLESFSHSVNAFVAYVISDAILTGLCINPINLSYIEEALEIVKTHIYPSVAEDGFKWPVASYFASKIQTSIRLTRNKMNF